MGKKLMKTFCLLMMTLWCASCSTTASLTSPCDVLVKQTPSKDTALYIVKNDRPFAQQVAQHRGRYSQYECGKK